MINAVKERLQALRASMREDCIDAYYITNSDYHCSEYTAEHFCALRYYSGFTGSFGILVLTLHEAGLWTDGRYFLQAEAELSGSGISLYRIGESGTPDIPSYLAFSIEKGGKLGLLCKTISCREYEALYGALSKKGLALKCSNLAYSAWKERPALPAGRAFLLEEGCSGKSAEKKLFELRNEMKLLGANVHVLASLADIAWLFNMRGDYTQHSPVLLSYAVIEESAAFLFLDAEALEQSLANSLKQLNVKVLPYDEVYSFFERYSSDTSALISKKSLNYALYCAVKKTCKVLDATNPTVYKKAIKNPVEIKNLYSAHIKDGIAVTKLIFSLKHKDAGLVEDEHSVSRSIEQLRLEQEGFIAPSFATIAAYGLNAAMVHYLPAEQGSTQLKKEGFLLLDSGGHYYEGTTDITRTISLGQLTHEQRHLYTLVLKGLLCLSSACFPKGCKGHNLDVLARAALWKEGLDYNHGTGHGVGYLLNVHEPPNSISFKHSENSAYTGVLEPGMVTSCEPGVYLEGSFGIRLENLLLCREAAFEGFLGFDTLTLAPFDLEAVDASLLCADEKAVLNAYHKRVYEALAPHLNDALRTWLREATRAV